MSHLVVIGTEGVSPRQSEPGERRLSGDPKFTTWGVETAANGAIVSGTWEVTPGRWHSTYEDKWEFCTLISGELIITEEGGAPVTIRLGDSFILRDGFKGVWEATTTSRKTYVVHFPKRG